MGGPRPAGEWPPGQPDGNPWLRAARLGPADPAIAEASRECFAAARSALDRMAAPAPITAAVDDFIEHYVEQEPMSSGRPTGGISVTENDALTRSGSRPS